MMNTRKGFTIIELSLASAFLGILLVTIALLVTHVITIYQKGMTLKSVNTIGEDLIDDFTRSISAASSTVSPGALCSMLSGENGDKCRERNANNYPGRGLIQQQRLSNAQIVNGGKIIDNVPISGSFCTGKYSYIWNSGYILDESTPFTYTKPGGTPFGANDRAKLTLGSGANAETKENFHLLRVQDPGREICKNAIIDGDYSNPSKNYRISTKVETKELLEKTEDNLALYDFTIFEPTWHSTTKQAYYSGTFILATIRGGVDIKASGEFCTDRPDNLNSDFAYCAINKFNFATRATGKGANND